MSMRVVVVGAGITGVCAAEWLRRDGHAVTLVDRVPPGDRGQASFGNAGLLARCSVVPVSVPGLLAKAPGMLLDPDSPLFLRWSYLPRLLPWLVPFLRNGRRERMETIVGDIAALTNDSVEQHEALAAGTPAARFIRRGEYGFLYPDRAAFEADAMSYALKRAHGFTWEEHEGAALQARDPGLQPGHGFLATFPDHGWITAPGPYVAALAETFRAGGGVVRAAEVADVKPGTVTLAGGEELQAERIVLSAGIWSRRFAEGLGYTVPLEAERGYHLMLRGASHAPSHPCMVTAGKFVVTPMEAGLRLAGVVEFGGTAAPPSAAPVDLLRRQVRKVYPGLTWEEEESWMGFRPSLPDSVPMLGESPRAPGVILAFGSQHLGLTIGPRLGRMVADLAAGRRANLDLTPYAVDRFNA
ncbi:FAD-binding oxidoreductase [Paroceanicella profunda]|uniref:FAD-binding oxidoreductase n=1 Tax=Paroceanicella profunda TaxID=2579971 RepID=A0A5B8FHE6_9RHOB|nr:FAD-binding oxidoreductase [Paroceanicella profunda]QDL92331.1 FAD-binding oxidoreductase [Paroceanicella profunda]